jgi:hypothetical protein
MLTSRQEASVRHSRCAAHRAAWNIASTLQNVIAPLLGSVVIFVAGQFGVLALGCCSIFGLATLFLILGAIFVLKVRETCRVATGNTAIRTEQTGVTMITCHHRAAVVMLLPVTERLRRGASY